MATLPESGAQPQSPQHKPLPFSRSPSREPRVCGCCQAPLQLDAPSWWMRCRECFAFGQLGRAVAVFKAAEAASREGSRVRVERSC
jgi:hypothetical protein